MHLSRIQTYERTVAAERFVSSRPRPTWDGSATHGKLHLPRRLLGIVAMRVHVVERPRRVVKAQDRLFTALCLWLHDVGINLIDAKLSPPRD